MSESTTDTPSTGKNVGGAFYSESTGHLLRPGVPMSPNARRVLDEINAGQFRGSDERTGAVHTVPHFVEFTMALRGQSAYEYFNEPAEVRRGLEKNVTNALKVIGCTLASADDSATEERGLQQSVEDGSGDRDPGAEADAEALRHDTAVRAQYVANVISNDDRRDLLSVIAALHPKLVLDTLTDVNNARRELGSTLNGWRP